MPQLNAVLSATEHADEAWGLRSSKRTHTDRDRCNEAYPVEEWRMAGFYTSPLQGVYSGDPRYHETDISTNGTRGRVGTISYDEDELSEFLNATFQHVDEQTCP